MLFALFISLAFYFMLLFLGLKFLFHQEKEVLGALEDLAKRVPEITYIPMVSVPPPSPLLISLLFIDYFMFLFVSFCLLHLYLF